MLFMEFWFSSLGRFAYFYLELGVLNCGKVNKIEIIIRGDVYRCFE